MQAGLSHPAIISPIAGCEVDGRFVVVYPFFRGKSSSREAFVTGGSNPTRNLAPPLVITQTLDGLEYLHSRKRVHGDLNLESLRIASEQIGIVDHCSTNCCNGFRPSAGHYKPREDFWALGIHIVRWILGGNMISPGEVIQGSDATTKALLNYLLRRESPRDPKEIRRLVADWDYQKAIN